MHQETSKVIEHILAAKDNREFFDRIKEYYRNSPDVASANVVHRAIQPRLVQALNETARVFENM